MASAWEVISSQLPKYLREHARGLPFERPSESVMGGTETARDIGPADIAETAFDVAAPLGLTSTEAQGAPKLRGASQTGLLAKALRSQPQGYKVTSSTPPEMAAALRGAPFPGIYKRPDELVAGAKVAPEDPLMQRLFGVTRDDLYGITQEGKRAGNITERPFNAPPAAKGAKHAGAVMTPQNEQRLVDIIAEARNRPDLFKGMASWYTMDPLFKRFVEIHGPERAVEEYKKFNTLTGMASPNSEVLTELNRGTGANWLASQGRFEDFEKFGGIPGHKRGAEFPEDMRAIQGHMVHKTAQAGPMAKYLREGKLDMGSAKVPSYIHASGVPETGFQTQWPVGDAHWSRLVGLPEHRGLVKNPNKPGEQMPNAASASVPEMVTLGPWWKEKVAERAGLESVPAQAVVWGAGSNATGVTSPIGAPKLELLAQQINKAANRMGVSPETARDMIIAGKAHAGFVDPKLLGVLGTVGAGGYGGYKAKQQVEGLRKKRDEKMKKVDEEQDNQKGE
jgi:hypothetical protein